MNTANINEISLNAEVEALKERFSNTQELYREVCALLFFRYGTTPTANKLYQLVRKGSMSAPSQALVTFWEELREKSRTRIEHPDLPETLTSAAGELIATLWRHAQEAAHESLRSVEAEAQAIAAKARADAAAFELERDQALQREQGTQHSLSVAQQEIISYRETLAAAKETKNALNTQLVQAQDDILSLQQQLHDSRKEFSVELEKLHLSAQLAESRSRDMEKRLMVDLDRERLAAAKAQKEVDTLRTAAQTEAQQQQVAAQQLQQQLQEAQHENSKLEGALTTLNLNLERADSELRTLYQQLAQTSAEMALLKEQHYSGNALKPAKAAKRKSMKVLEGRVRRVTPSES
ncbi:MAG: DNA-binding protein [Paenalcaligenes sp.]